MHSIGLKTTCEVRSSCGLFKATTTLPLLANDSHCFGIADRVTDLQRHSSFLRGLDLQATPACNGTPACLLTRLHQLKVTPAFTQGLPVLKRAIFRGFVGPFFDRFYVGRSNFICILLYGVGDRL